MRGLEGGGTPPPPRLLFFLADCLCPPPLLCHCVPAYGVSSAPRVWSTRVLPKDIQSGPQGVALEHIIALCNAVHAVPWLLLPGAASTTDSYLTGLANLFATTLDPSLSIIFEYAAGTAYTQVCASVVACRRVRVAWEFSECARVLRDSIESRCCHVSVV